MTFSEQIVYGMTKPSKYKEILELKKRRFVLYVFVLVIALAIMSYAIPTAAIITGFGGFEKLFTKNLAPLEFCQGELNIERPFDMSIGYAHIVVDSSEDVVTSDKIHKDGIYYAVGKQKLTLAYCLDGKILQKQDVNLNLLLPEGFNNQALCNMIPGIYTFLVLGFFVTALGFFLRYGFYTLLIAVCVNAMSKRINTGLSFGKVFTLCFYGQSLAMVVSNVNFALGLLPSMIVSIIGFFVTIHFITTALISMSKINQV